MIFQPSVSIHNGEDTDNIKFDDQYFDNLFVQSTTTGSISSTTSSTTTREHVTSEATTDPTTIQPLTVEKIISTDEPHIKFDVYDVHDKSSEDIINYDVERPATFDQETTKKVIDVDQDVTTETTVDEETLTTATTLKQETTRPVFEEQCKIHNQSSYI